jgi:hypothetical protein
MLSVETLEVAVTRLMKEHDDGQHFREAQGESSVALSRLKQAFSP